MIQVKNVVDALYGLIGWRQDLSDNISISSGLVASESGLYYQDSHPLLTLKNLASIAPDFSNRGWDAYDSAKVYRKGDVVEFASEGSSESAIYRCKVDGTTGYSPEDNTRWEEIDPFSVWLEEKTRASIANAVNRFIYSAMPKGGTKSILEHRLLFNSVGRIADRLTNKNDVVGLEIHPIHAYDASVRIHRIGLQAVNPDSLASEDELRVVIKSSNDMLGSVYADDIVVGGYGTKWTDIETSLANTQGGQSLYAFYSQADLETLGMEAVNRTIDWSKAPCSACNNVDHYAFLAWSKFIEVHPFRVSADNLIQVGNAYTFDQQSLEYVNHTNFGLNMEISVYCDYTDFIIRNRGEFVPLLLKQVAVDMLKEFAYNPSIRANRNSVNASRSEIMLALEGSDKAYGLYRELEDMYSGLNISMHGLGKVRRPCNNGGLRYTTT